jgi:hypothetical protein
VVGLVQPVHWGLTSLDTVPFASEKIRTTRNVLVMATQVHPPTQLGGQRKCIRQLDCEDIVSPSASTNAIVWTMQEHPPMQFCGDSATSPDARPIVGDDF